MAAKKLLSLYVYFSLCFGHFIRGSPINENLKVELVQVLFRHGARTPLQCEAMLLTNMRNDSIYEPWGLAELTKDGMREEYNIGIMLRNRYKDFLPELYNSNDVYAYSSSISRSKASLHLLLAALYPPKGNFVWNDDLNWMPIPIHSNPNPVDIMVKPRNCPRFQSTFQELHNTTKIKKAFAEYGDIIQMLKNVFLKDYNIHKMMCMYNLLFIHKNLNFPLPSWFTDEFYSRVTKATKLYLETLSYTPTLNRLNGGTMVRRFVENLNNSNLNITRRKIYLYSAHDKNVYAFIKAHGLIPKRLPDYGVSVIIEKLRDEQNKVYVRLLLWTGNPKKLTTLKLEKCTEICPLKEYLKIVNPIIPSDDEMRCLIKNLQTTDLENILNDDLSSTIPL